MPTNEMLHAAMNILEHGSEQSDDELEHCDILGHSDEDVCDLYDVEPEDNMSTLAHIGVKYRSGRFEYGSGSRPHQHDNPYVFVDDNGNFEEYDWGNFDRLMKDASNSLSTTKSGFDTLRNYIDPERKPLSRKNYLGKAQQMSDEELRAAINRMQMEQNYNRMMQEMYPSKRTKAEQTLSKVLAGTGMVLSVAGPAVGLAAGIVAMKKAAQDKSMISQKEKEAVAVLNDLLSKGVSIKDVNAELTNANKFVNLYVTGKGGKG